MFEPITTEINECEGINPHLNSQMQGANWEEFHHLHIADLHAELRKALLDTPYQVRLGRSLQVRDVDNIGHLKPPRPLIPDLSIRDKGGPENRPALRGPVEPNDATLYLETAEAMNVDPNDFLYALAIWENEQQVQSSEPGKERPVAWIELLSPSNKPGGAHYAEYEAKRWAAIQDGQTLVEIDYLHESGPMIQRLPRYRPDKLGHVPEGARAYSVAVLDPRSSEKYPQGSAFIYQFSPEDSLPTVTIPLNPGYKVDLDAAYDNTLLRHYSGEIDYTQLPERIHTYSAADRDRMAARQLTIMDADPEVLHDPNRTAPLPLAFLVEGASQKLDNILKGIEDFPPHPASDEPGPSGPDINL